MLAASSSLVAELLVEASVTFSEISYRVFESFTSFPEIPLSSDIIPFNCSFILFRATPMTPISSFVIGISCSSVMLSCEISSITAVSFVIGFVILLVTRIPIPTAKITSITPIKRENVVIVVMDASTSDLSASTYTTQSLTVHINAMYFSLPSTLHSSTFAVSMTPVELSLSSTFCITGLSSIFLPIILGSS